MAQLATALCCAVLGIVHNSNGEPITDARVKFAGVSPVYADSSGRFSIQLAPGPHGVVISASGFGATAIDRVDVRKGSILDVTLEPLAAGSLRTIGQVAVDGKLAVSRGTIPSQSITRSSLDAEGTQHLTDALNQVTSLTMPRPDSGSPAAVAVVALRGPDPSETLVSLDGQIRKSGEAGAHAA